MGGYHFLPFPPPAPNPQTGIITAAPRHATFPGALPRHQRLSGEAALQQASSVVAAIAGLAEPRVTHRQLFSADDPPGWGYVGPGWPLA